MADDKLLAKVEHYNYMEAGDLIKALRAVVELHQKYEDENLSLYCQACEYTWPCPTIQAIEKELG